MYRVGGGVVLTEWVWECVPYLWFEMRGREGGGTGTVSSPNGVWGTALNALTFKCLNLYPHKVHNFNKWNNFHPLIVGWYS